MAALVWAEAEPRVLVVVALTANERTNVYDGVVFTTAYDWCSVDGVVARGVATVVLTDRDDVGHTLTLLIEEVPILIDQLRQLIDWHQEASGRRQIGEAPWVV